MPSIKSLHTYLIDHADDVTLSNVIAGIQLITQDKPFAHQIQVIDESVQFDQLEKGYYLRVLKRDETTFHLYGIEVTERGKLIVHENIPEKKLNEHWDLAFKDQLIALHQQQKINFHVANTVGGGLALHENLAQYYAQHGTIGNHVNPQLDKPTPVKPIVQKEKSPHANALLLTLASGLFSGAGALTLIIGTIALMLIAPPLSPIGIGIMVSGAMALGLGLGGLRFFGSQLNQQANETTPTRTQAMPG